jgi:DHA1 family tetracycline resistance protein-like MFS transporter
MQGLASNNIGANQQGELQGGIESAMSLTAIISPILMTQTFGYFTSSAAPVYFPGAAFVLAGLLTACSLLLFIKVTAGSQGVNLKN